MTSIRPGTRRTVSSQKGRTDEGRHRRTGSCPPEAGLQEKEYAAARTGSLCDWPVSSSPPISTAWSWAEQAGLPEYYDEDLAEVTIPLDPLLTPQQNAAK